MDYREFCSRFYKAARLAIVPTLQYSQTAYEAVLFSHVASGGRWLDLGCGHHVLPPWRREQECSLTRMPQLMVGLDYDAHSLRKHKTIRNLVRGDISTLPFSTDAFDLVTANMVFEHLADPERQLREIFRILKPGGSLIFHTPNPRLYGIALARLVPESLKAKVIWLLERRRQEDVFPTYYRINTEKAIRELAKRVGFRVMSLQWIASSALFIMIPPLVVIELLLTRLLMAHCVRRFRPNMIVVLSKSCG